MARERTIHPEEACTGCRSYLPAYAAGRLDEVRERQVRDHLAGCAACRQALVTQADPSAIFLELRGQPLPETFWTGFQARLRSRLEEERPAYRYALLRYPRLAYVAPLAMVLVLGATLLVVRPVRLAQRGLWRPEGIRPPQSHVQGAPLSQPPLGTPPRGRRELTVPPGVVGLGAGFSGQGAGSAPLMEEIGSPGARVYRF